MALGETATGLEWLEQGWCQLLEYRERRGALGWRISAFLLLFCYVFDGRVGSSLYNGVGHTPISCLNFPICKL